MQPHTMSEAFMRTAIARPLVQLAALSTTMALSACGFLFSHAPPAGHESMSSFSCTEQNAGPILDIVWGGLNVLGALTAASDPAAYENSDQIVAVGLTWGVVSGTAAAVGFNKSKKCRAARALLAQRTATGVPGPADTLDASAPAAVTIAPLLDTLRVGARLQLVATAHTSSGVALTGRLFYWTSSNDAIASVNEAGTVSANAPGTVVVAARTGSVVGTARLVVVPQ